MPSSSDLLYSLDEDFPSESANLFASFPPDEVSTEDDMLMRSRPAAELEVVLRASKESGGGAVGATSWAISASSRTEGAGAGVGASTATLGLLAEASVQSVLPLALAALGGAQQTVERGEAAPQPRAADSEAAWEDLAGTALLCTLFLLLGVLIGKAVGARERRAEEEEEAEEADEEACGGAKPRCSDAGAEAAGGGVACSAHLMEAPFM